MKKNKNNRYRPFASRTSALVVIAIVTIATILSVVSYLSYNYTVASVGNSAIQSIHANSQAEVRGMSNLVRVELGLVSDNLEVISNSKSVEIGNVSSAEELFLAAQNATSNLTFAYGWVNRTGAIIYSTNETIKNQANAEGLNVSESPFFIGAKQSGNTYFSTSFVSEVTGRQIISAARPVYNTELVNGQQVRVFNGIVSASILLLSIGRFLISQLPSNISNAGLVDPNGVILYAREESLVGSNIYGEQFQGLLPSYLKEPFYSMINQSLKGQTGYVDFRSKGVNSTIAYEPVYAPTGGSQNFSQSSSSSSSSSNSQEFAIAYVGVADTLGAAQISQINFDRDLSLVTITGITGAALIASVIVLERNRRLDELVAVKTGELASSNQKLSEELAKEEVLLSKERRSRKEAELLQDILAHDLRNYNQITKMSAELLTMDQNLKSPESKTLVDGILGAVDRSTELIERAKKLGKILSEGSPRLGRVNLNDSLARSLDVVTKAHPDRAIYASLPDAKQDDAYVLADDLLDEVFMNILSNSVKYTSKGERVLIDVLLSEETVMPDPSSRSSLDSTSPTTYWKVAIADHAKGMVDEVKSKAFTRYLDSAQGSGLGLSIVYALIVERYSGKVEVKDRVANDYSKGTVVSVWLRKFVGGPEAS